jgi:hypothetical protein
MDSVNTYVLFNFKSSMVMHIYSTVYHSIQIYYMTSTGV